jgi:hypothetical protein
MKTEVEKRLGGGAQMAEATTQVDGHSIWLTMRDLELATQLVDSHGFDNATSIGSGSYGTVFKCTKGD